jgi:hypothetical protein
MRNNPKQRSSHLLRGGSLKSSRLGEISKIFELYVLFKSQLKANVTSASSAGYVFALIRPFAGECIPFGIWWAFIKLGAFCVGYNWKYFYYEHICPRNTVCCFPYMRYYVLITLNFACRIATVISVGQSWIIFLILLRIALLIITRIWRILIGCLMFF